MVDFADDLPVGVDEEEGGNGTDAVEVGGEGGSVLAAGFVEDVYPGGFIFRDGLFPMVGIAVDGDTEDLKTLIMIFLIKVFETRHALAAGLAPGGPEIDQDKVPAQGRERDGIAFPVRQGELRGFQPRLRRLAGDEVFTQAFREVAVFHLVREAVEAGFKLCVRRLAAEVIIHEGGSLDIGVARSEIDQRLSDLGGIVRIVLVNALPRLVHVAEEIVVGATRSFSVDDRQRAVLDVKERPLGLPALGIHDDRTHHDIVHGAAEDIAAVFEAD